MSEFLRNLQMQERMSAKAIPMQTVMAPSFKEEQYVPRATSLYGASVSGNTSAHMNYSTIGSLNHAQGD